ncbi:signal recognition particle-docking protein FtsY [Leptolyngbya sp. PCC 6406]|uniref:signal recognition particle-docking protein FtsY n=1 Tax=Leptolyngbya sp. PCC 6406 TaxID=1173264 RepID=UPI0002ABD20D|nr:signal recognition particle-docking protein FtsY [Leptolyngbya sp. PCC 6406]
MAEFNWFSRSHSAAPAGESPAEPQSSEPAPAETPVPAAEDYLAWAKAAYQNIQKQQAVAAASPEASSPEESSSPEADPEAATAPDATKVTERPEPPVAPETLTAETSPETLPAAMVTDRPKGAIADPEPKPEPEADPQPAVPAWMQANAERQARLERLRETAIAEPEPEPNPQPRSGSSTPVAPTPVLPDLNFDEAFLWSAEVLAAQGRRAEDISVEEITWLNRLRQGLDKTRRSLVNQLKAIVGQGPLNDDAVLEIEALLLQADVGVEATDTIIQGLQQRLREETLPPEQAIAFLKQLLRDMLDRPLGEDHNLTFVPDKETLNVWLMTGVNGAGKTTTIGKLAHIATKSGYTCLIAAADTFRAAAVEQVKAWGARSNVQVISNPGQNTDPASVVFDAIAAAQSRGVELLLVDTAGRLQNKKNLMDELTKVRRIIDKKAPNARIESLLVLDATLGQNGLRQAQVFAEAASLSGVVLTKLDGTAKGGVALAVVQQLGLPIRFIGAGEGIEDLRPFSSYEFVEALLSS